MNVNIGKLRGKIAEQGLTGKKIAAKLGINESTYYKKIKRDACKSFTIKQAYDLADILNCDSAEAANIFFGD